MAGITMMMDYDLGRVCRERHGANAKRRCTHWLRYADKIRPLHSLHIDVKGATGMFDPTDGSNEYDDRSNELRSLRISHRLPSVLHDGTMGRRGVSRL